MEYKTNFRVWIGVGAILTVCATGSVAAVSGERGGLSSGSFSVSGVEHREMDEVGSRFSSPNAEFSSEAALDDLLRHAAEYSPEMGAAFEEWRAAVERGPQARALPDPRVSYGYFLQRMETRQAVSLSQAFPWFGVRDLRGGIAEERARAAGERFEAERRKVFAAVKTAYADYAYAFEAVEIVERNRGLVERLSSVVEGLLTADRVGMADLLRIQSELDRVEDELRGAETFREPAAAALNRALGRPAGAVLPELRPILAEPFPEETKEALLHAVRNHPNLLAGDYAVAAGEKEIRLARREGYPEFGVGVEWMENPGMRDEVRGMVTMSLPVWRERYAAGVREAQAGREQARFEREARELELETRLAMTIFRLRDAERKVALYRDSLVPRARQTIESVEGAYRAGRAGFLDLVESQRTLLDLELAQARAIADQFQRFADLEELVGTVVFSSLEHNPTPEFEP